MADDPKKPEDEAAKSGRTLDRRDVLLGLSTVPALGLFGYAWQKQRSYEQKQRQAAEEFKKRLAEVSLQFSVQVGDEDQLYGSVTVSDIHEALEKQGFEIERRNVRLAEPLKALGMFEVPVHLFQDIEAPVKVWVVRK